MPLGLLVLAVVTLLIAMGLTQRVLDRLHLTEGQALVVVLLMAAGSFVDLKFTLGGAPWEVNLGGGLIPLGLIAYVFGRADTAVERWRSLFSLFATAAIIWGIAHVTDFDAGRTPALLRFIDPLWLFGLIAGVLAYLAGRSRRAAFIGGSGGVLLSLLVTDLLARRAGMDVPVRLGGGGIFDGSVIAGVIGLGLAEWVGEVRERISTGGSTSTGASTNAGAGVRAGTSAGDSPGNLPGGPWGGQAE